MEDFFLALGDLPLHPLVVHFAVALFPLALIYLITATVSAKLRQKNLLKAIVSTAATVPFIFLSVQSGEALSEVMYEPNPHAEYGEQLMPLALITLAVSLLLWYSLKSAWPRLLSQVLGFVLVCLSLGAIALTVVIGHSGAAATWTGIVP